MSNDRHNPDIARTMGSAVARDPGNDAARRTHIDQNRVGSRQPLKCQPVRLGAPVARILHFRASVSLIGRLISF